MHCSNAPRTVKEWASGEVLAFGNSPPSKAFEKAKAGRKYLEEIVNRNLGKDELVGSLMQMLQNDEKHWPDSELLGRALKPEWASELSSIYVKIPAKGYGTR